MSRGCIESKKTAILNDLIMHRLRCIPGIEDGVNPTQSMWLRLRLGGFLRVRVRRTWHQEEEKPRQGNEAHS